jgi:hypothetical protein
MARTMADGDVWAGFQRTMARREAEFTLASSTPARRQGRFDDAGARRAVHSAQLERGLGVTLPIRLFRPPGEALLLDRVIQHVQIAGMHGFRTGWGNGSVHGDGDTIHVSRPAGSSVSAC